MKPGERDPFGVRGRCLDQAAQALHVLLSVAPLDIDGDVGLPAIGLLFTALKGSFDAHPVMRISQLVFHLGGHRWITHVDLQIDDAAAG